MDKGYSEVQCTIHACLLFIMQNHNWLGNDYIEIYRDQGFEEMRRKARYLFIKKKKIVSCRASIVFILVL